MDMHLHLHDGLHALIREVAERDGVSVEAAVITAVEDFVASRQTRGVPEQSRKTVEQDTEPPRRPAE
ncbi:CopG family transcriptional regulator [Nocardiopsis dassonvillei]|uniref:CopG family transcriptional regulator n=1 Tax=Nocardiopsis dassonvillei TaxID=2014 RepID=UPI003638AC2A